MAIRVHVAAAFGDEMEGFVRAVSSPLELEAETSGPWIWATSSAWNVAGGDLDRALANLPCPTMRITTVDAALWELRLQAPGRELVALTHNFNLLRLDMEEEFSGYENVEDLVEDGWMEPEQAAGVADLSPLEAMQKVTEENNAAIAQAASAIGLPGAADELRAVLEGAGVPPEELGWDIGNLPRFLSALGLDGPFGDWRAQIETERREREQRRREAEANPDDLLIPLELTLAGVQEEAIEGGPVELSMEHLSLVPWSCNREMTAGVRIVPPHGTPPPDVSAVTYEDPVMVQTPQSTRIGAHYQSKSTFIQLCAGVQPLLQTLPDETVVDLLCAEHREDEGTTDLVIPEEEMTPEMKEMLDAEMEAFQVNTAGDHLYRGKMRSGAWQVEACYPPASREDLEQACALFAFACRGEPLPVSDEEAEAVLAAVEKDIYLHEEEIEHRGGALVPDESPRFLATQVFRQRFRHVWDVEQGEAIELALYKDFYEDPLDDEPPRGEVLQKGGWSTFYHSTMEGWQGLTAEDVAAMDGRMKEIGLEPLGDMVAEAAGAIVLRAYGSPGARLLATWMVGAFDTRVVDMFTTFEEGGSLTTTTNPVVFSDEPAGLFKQKLLGGTPAQLFKMHREKLLELGEQGRAAAEQEVTLEGVARSIDEFMG